MAKYARHFGFMALLAFLGVSNLAHAADSYTINQQFGEIEFSVNHLGLFSSHGGFGRWNGNLTLDQVNPERSQVDVTIDADSVFMPWEDGVAMLRSPPYFDVAGYPAIHFKTTEVKPVSPNNYLIRGSLQIRGITRPQDFTATLVDRRMDPALRAEVADFVVTGKLIRSMFGMTADKTLISDAVTILIRAHLKLGASTGAN